jgi:hypothetical protein
MGDENGPRIIGEPGPIRIRMVSDKSEEEARRLIAEGGECGSWEVFCAIVNLLGDVRSSDTMTEQQAALCFYREGKASIECDYRIFWCAITQEIEVRESPAIPADAEGE